MIQGYFGDNGTLYFEIDLIAADASVPWLVKKLVRF